jgi:hypothetical protein
MTRTEGGADFLRPRPSARFVSGPIVTKLLDPPPGVPDGGGPTTTKKPRALSSARFDEGSFFGSDHAVTPHPVRSSAAGDSNDEFFRPWTRDAFSEQ